MKTLIILRHGKAEFYQVGKSDYERTLTERGEKNAADMGKFVAETWGVPALILTSSAARALQTAKLAASAMNYPETEIMSTENLYLVPSETVLQALSKLPKHIESCMVVGHNPGLTDLVNDLGVYLDDLPTASAVCFTFDTKSWRKISKRKAKFVGIKTAREL